MVLNTRISYGVGEEPWRNGRCAVLSNPSWIDHRIAKPRHCQALASENRDRNAFSLSASIGIQCAYINMA